MTVNAFFFVDKLRSRHYVTLIDSLQDTYGNVLGGLIYLPSCLGDICWTAAVLTALGMYENCLLILLIQVINFNRWIIRSYAFY